jgi:hypothetical protein
MKSATWGFNFEKSEIFFESSSLFYFFEVTGIKKISFTYLRSILKIKN